MLKLTQEEHREIARRTKKLFAIHNQEPGKTLTVREFLVDYVPECGIWVYVLVNGSRAQIYGRNEILNNAFDVEDSAHIREALKSFRRMLVLEDLADV